MQLPFPTLSPSLIFARTQTLLIPSHHEHTYTSTHRRRRSHISKPLHDAKRMLGKEQAKMYVPRRGTPPTSQSYHFRQTYHTAFVKPDFRQSVGNQPIPTFSHFSHLSHLSHLSTFSTISRCSPTFHPSPPSR